MSLVSQPSFTNSLIASPEAKKHTRRSSLETTEATLGSLLGALTDTSQNLMERSATTYSSQPGSHSSYTPALPEAQPEENSSAHGSAANHYTPSPGIKSSTDSPPEYGVYPASACSSSFPEHINRQNQQTSSHSGSSGGMPPSTSPSLPLQDGRSNHHHPQITSDQDVPIDPSISASSPTYSPHAGQYSPYPPQQEMSQAYSSHAPGSMYTQPRPDWAGYSGHASHPPHTMQGGYAVTGAQNSTATAPAGGRSGQVSDFQHSMNGIPRGYSSALPRAMQSGHPYSVPVYSFVPIPGAQQHKRPRRRYEEIERMYKCGWNGCEKAYGTLNHLNAHVTMQSHGTKRTPEEFKEIRKEWKARKKEEENQRKADEDRNRTVVSNDSHHEGAPTGYPPSNRSVQLPPIGFQTGSQVSPQYQSGPQSTTVQQIQQDFTQNQSLSYSGYPASPYGATSQMYIQSNPNLHKDKLIIIQLKLIFNQTLIISQ
ncbi:C2H2 finger domain transcription factor CON7 [Golovinomyces cichoracearum]|uniref:C2H2 finger domain transcription factor CON7 n=1 Tax=Golovinomyces cichoracearum TaxID=62708 RepID=A0A420ICQ6_9PEZI|nr:C2H2 finger domain transcription factor CON7 [Golovinomyces cichoracearum]